MKREQWKNFCIAGGILAAFVLWTLGLCVIDVQPIGPQGSSVGFAALNGFVHELTGVDMFLYEITDWLGLVPIAFAMGFAFFGFAQWIRRGNIFKVDRNILVLGVLYATVAAAYIFFEKCAVNYRPVLIDGYLEASYPSSTTLLVLCVMLTAMMQFHARIKNQMLKHCMNSAIIIFMAFMVIGRLVSGVHWFSDIVGGVLLSAGLVMLYYSVGMFEYD